jgi:hypothetical protein
MNNYKIGDVVKTTPKFGSRTFVIFALTPTGYRGIESTPPYKSGLKRYPLTIDQIEGCIAEVAYDNPLLVASKYDLFAGREYCLRQAVEFPTESRSWKFLANLKPGDLIRLAHRKKIFPEAEFIGINVTRPLYPIRAKIKGNDHDFRREALILPGE